MPAFDRFYIGPTKNPYTGQVTRYKPFLLPSGAMQTLRNFYVFREVIRKRPGAVVMDRSQDAADQQLFTRLRVNLGNTDSNGDISVTAPGTVGKIGQMFSIGSEKFTVYQAGTPAAMYTTGSATTATYNTTSRALVIAGAAATTACYFYPAEPVMHIGLYEDAQINRETTIAFDTQFAYTYTDGSGWSRLTGGASANTWTTDSDKDYYYWSTNYRGAAEYDYTFYVTNNVAADAMRYYDGTNWNAWGSLATTPLGGGSYIVTCRVMATAAQRFILMNTLEYDGSTNRRYVNRIRYSADTSALAPTNASAWLVTNAAGFIDLPTKEAIVSAYNLKDVIIIECERSTYRLTLTGNALEPFIIEQINSEVGIESVNSMIGFDQQVIGFGSTGIHACNGQNVSRIDEMIPDQIFDVNNANSGPSRVQGVRDYFNEMAYWTYNSRDAHTDYNEIWPNRFLIFDYLKGAWAYVDDSISAFGYFYKQATTTKQIGFQSILCGNQEGWTFRLRDDITRNSSSLQITKLSFVTTTVTVTAIDHNLPDGSYVYIANVQSDNGAYETQLNGKIFQVTTTSTSTFTITVGAEPTGATYEGCGTIERVSEPEIYTKEYNFYGDNSKSIAFMQVNFYVDKTDNGEFTVDFIPSASSISLLTDATSSGAIIGNNIIETTPYTLAETEQYQDRFWHSVTFQATGEVIQLHIYLSDTQLKAVEDSDYVAFQDIQINGMIFFTRNVQEFG